MIRKKVRIHTLALPVASIISKRRKPNIHMVISGRPDTVFFAGFGNEGASLDRILSLLKLQGIEDIAVVGPMPYWHIPATAEDIKALGITGAAAAATYLREQYNISILHVLGESQTAGAVAHAATEHPDLFNGRVGLLRPLGLTTMTRAQFKKGLRSGILHPDQFFDWRAWPVGIVAAWRVLQDRIRHGGKQFDMGITWDIRKELRSLQKRRAGQVRVFAATHDMLFPVESIKLSLESADMGNMLEVIPGMHASPATQAGSVQVAHAVRWCKSDIAAR